jgi:hypothetical protein
MRSLILFFAAAAALAAQQLTFSPQGGSKVSTWAVTGCAPKAIPVAQIYAIATAHGITWLVPSVAGDQMSKRTLAGKIVRIGTFVAAGASALLTLKVVQANAAIVAGVTSGGGFLGSLLPLASQQVPKPDSAAGADLAIATSGCGAMTFYAVPSKIGAFTETLK